MVNISLLLGNIGRVDGFIYQRLLGVMKILVAVPAFNEERSIQEVIGRVGYLKHDLLHYGNPTFAVYIERRFNRYTDIMAKEVNGGLFQYLFWRPLFDPLQGFIPVYFRHLGFLDGFPGFIWALYQALNFPIAYFKSLDIKDGRA